MSVLRAFQVFTRDLYKLDEVLFVSKRPRNMNIVTFEIKFLTPKGPACVFWQHRNFGQVCVIGDLHISSLNFDRRWGQGISLICTKFHDIWNYESKVMA